MLIRIISRLVYLVAGLSSLYMAVAPALSGMSDAHSSWTDIVLDIVFGSAAILMIVAALGPHDFGSLLAAIGSSAIVAVYGCYVVMQILVRLGYYHVETRLTAPPAQEPPRWRFIFDRPILFLLFYAALISLGLALRSVVTRVKRRPEPDGSPRLAK